MENSSINRSPSQARILLVDDQPSNRATHRAILEDLGHVLVEASSGEEALRTLLQDQFAVVLLDVRMAGLDGLETARLVRQREQSRHTPIIFISGYEGDRDIVERAYALGAVDFLTKPLVPTILRAKVAVFVDLFEKSEEIRRHAERRLQAEREEFEHKLRAEALRQAEARLELAAIVENSEDAIIGKTLDGVITSWNAGAERLYGYSSQEVVGRPVATLIPPDRPEEFTGVVERLCRGDHITPYETVRLRKDGRRIDVSERVSPIRNASGHLTGVSVIARDITGRRLAENRRNVRLAATEILANADDIRAAIPGILEAICRSLEWDVGAFWIVDPEPRVIRCAEFWAQPATSFPEFEQVCRETAFHPNGSLPGRVWASGRPVWIPNVVEDSNFLRAAVAARQRLHGAFACPVRIGTQVLAVIEFFSREIREPDADLLEMMNSIAGQLGQFMERKRAEAEREQVAATLNGLIASAPIGIALLDQDMRFQLVNEPLAQMNGLPGEDHLGRSIAEVVPELAAAAAVFFHQVVSTGAPVVDQVLEGPSPTAPHQRGWWQESWFPVPGPDGTLARVGVTVQDITERKRADETLRKQNERLQLLSRVAAHLLTVHDPDSMVRGLYSEIEGHFGLDAYFNFLMNEADDTLHLESYAGVSDEVASTLSTFQLGQPVCGAVARDRRPIVLSHIRESDDQFAAGLREQGFRAYACYPLLAGRQLIGTISFGSRARDQFEPDELNVLQTIAHDLTVAYERLRLVEQLREADRRKDEFLATLAHELRNPLASMRSAVQLLQLKGPPDPELRYARDIIERQAAQLARLLDDLLDISRITHGKLELRKQRLTLQSVLERAVEQSRPGIDEKRHRLTLDVPDTSLLLEGDAARLAQVFANLLSNAAKYTDPGGHIALTGRQQDHTVIVSVRDDGIGIAPEHLPHVFELFSQAGSALERSQGGLGIGLSLVNSLVRMHGGSVEARSDGPGRGSEFIVRLPALSEKATVAAVPAEIAQSQTATRKRRVLVVDDNQDAARLLAMMLSFQGHEVETAHDGEAAVQAARDFQPHVALLDIGLPKLNGYEACRQIRSLPGESDMILVALTGWGQEEDRRRAIEAGFDHHFTKPLDISQLRPILDG